MRCVSSLLLSDLSIISSISFKVIYSCLDLPRGLKRKVINVLNSFAQSYTIWISSLLLLLGIINIGSQELKYENRLPIKNFQLSSILCRTSLETIFLLNFFESDIILASFGCLFDQILFSSNDTHPYLVFSNVSFNDRKY